MSSAEVNKKLKLSIGICKRLVKEADSYKKEVEKQEAKIQKMRDEGEDPYGNLNNRKFLFSLMAQITYRFF